MERTRVVLTGLGAALLGLTALLVLPFVEFLLLAVLLAYPLRPLQRRFEGHLGPKLTAGGLVLVATLAIVLPMLALLRVVVREVRSFLDRIESGEIAFKQLEAEIASLTGREIDLRESLQSAIESAGVGTVDGVLGLFQTLTSLLIGLALTLFLLYYFLKDADRFNGWLRATSPLPDRIYDELHREFDDVMWAVLVSHVFIAVVQGVVAGIGLIVLGVPNAVFWTAAMVILAVLPIIGSFLVWGPAALYLFSIGQPLAGGVLFVYGLIVVSLCDDFLRPLVIERYTESRLNPGAIVLGVIGGVYLLGFIGIFFGPVIIGSLRAVLDVYRREYVESGPAADPDAEVADSPAGAADTRVEESAATRRGNPPDPAGETPTEE
ncbi:MAG: putative PurR-regulated permease PerM [Halovenus sp.]|jgi:predicted PurR-regulated permease PerM